MREPGSSVLPRGFRSHKLAQDFGETYESQRMGQKIEGIVMAWRRGGVADQVESGTSVGVFDSSFEPEAQVW